MNKQEFIARIAEKNNITKSEAEKALNIVLDGLVSVVPELKANNDKLQLVGYLTISVKEVAERKARNPQTGEEIIIPAKSKVAIKLGKNFAL